MRINVTNLKAFFAVARNGGFTAAAEQCRVSQPTLTRQVRELEERYGVQLFERSTRRVRLTATGEQLLAMSERIFAELDRADRFLQTSTGTVLNVYSVRTEMLPRFIQVANTHFAASSIQISLMPSRQVHEGLLSYACDFGFLTMPEEARGVQSVRIGRYPVIAFVNERHAWRGTGRISLRQLEGEVVIIGSTATQTRRTFDREIARLGVRLASIIEVDDSDVIFAMAQAGRGIGVLGATGKLDRREADALRFEEPEMAQDLHLAVAGPSPRNPMISTLFQIFGTQCAQPGEPELNA